jgi:hypothetical protein
MSRKPDVAHLHKDNHLYQADAVAASGHLTLPVEDRMQLQGSIALPLGGGHGRVNVGNFSHHGIFSFRSAYSEVSGHKSDTKGSHNTLAQSVIEGINIHNVLTCDRIVSRIAVHQPKDGGQASIIPFGSTIDNLRIGGYPVRPVLNMKCFVDNDNFNSLVAYRKNNKKEAEKTTIPRSEDPNVPPGPNVIACTMVTDWGEKSPDFPPGVEVHGTGLWVPEFGMVYVAELYIMPNTRRLRMLRVVLGCGSEGGVETGGSGGGTVGW